ncbi:unnamed protein product [Trichobilharzia regenti]|nr:unnamed protein product [Trichobilharzia regenti]
MRTCWQRVNEFRLVGIMLKTAYDQAIRVTYEPRLDILKRINIGRGTSNYEKYIHNSNNNNYPNKRNPSSLSTRYKHDTKNWLVVINNHSNNNNNNNNNNNGLKQDHNEYLNSERLLRRWPRMTTTKSREMPKNKLVYLEESPNYCYFDESIGKLIEVLDFPIDW